MDALYRDIQRSLALEEIIRDEIRATGPMTFARFMDLVLYHPTLGYYRSGFPMTRSGDFLTAPETHPIFGALLARFVRAAAQTGGWEEAHVVEQGAGTGALARSFRAYWSDAYPKLPLRYTIVEPHAGARATLRDHAPGADVVASIEAIAPFTGVFLSNELPDAFPVHRVRRLGGALVEVYVDEAGGRLMEVDGPVSSTQLATELKANGVGLAAGQEIEVNMALGPWIADVAAALSEGYVLTVDYGYAASEAHRFPRGTLLAHYRHGINEEYLARIGRQDLTAHVCWTGLERHGAEAGLRPLEQLSQREFLTRWGWKEYGRWLLAQPFATHERLDAVDRLGRTEDGLGGLGVLLQAKGTLPAPRPEEASPAFWEAV